jgi:hypothetical protein
MDHHWGIQNSALLLHVGCLILHVACRGWVGACRVGHFGLAWPVDPETLAAIVQRTVAGQAHTRWGFQGTHP